MVHSAIVAGAAMGVLLQSVSAAPVSAIEARSVALASAAGSPSGVSFAVENPMAAAESHKQSEILPASEEFLPTGSVAGWFDREVAELDLSGGKSALQIDPHICVYPDSYLGNPGSGDDNCRVFPPSDKSEFSLWSLALSVWVSVVVAGAVSYHGYRRWRARRWLRHLRDRGLALPVSGKGGRLLPAASRPIHVMRRSRRLRSRARPRRRSYAS